MAVEAPIRAQDEWFLGEDKTLRFHVTTGPEITVTADAANGATSISVSPLKEGLSNGDKVRFGNVVATLDADAAVGAKALSIDALVGNIYRHDEGAKVQSLSGFTLEWVLRTSPEASAATLTKDNDAVGGISITDAANGVAEVTITDDDTVNLDPGSYSYTFRRVDAAAETVLAYGSVALLRPSAL